MRQYTNILFFIVLFLLLGNSNAQSFDNPIFTRIYAENGLTQDNITAIEQDAYGFIWIGSQEGLTRWDGSSFEHYLNSPENINSLANDYISDVFTSGDKRLWVATLGGGLHYYSPVANDFVRIVAATQEVNDKLRNIRTLFEDQNNRLWIGTENHGVFLLDLETNQVNAFSVDNSAENPPLLKIRDIKGDNHGRVWIASEGSGISMWDEKKYLLINYSSNTSSNTSIPTNDFYTVQPMPDGTIWAGSYNNGLVIINPYRRESTNWRHEPENYYSLADNRVRSIFRDSRDRIWLGTDNGLDLWDSDIRGFHHFSFDPGARHTLSDNRVTKITQDRGGVLWVGTFSGLNKWNAKLGSISHVKRVPNAPSSLSSNIVTSFADSVQGDIWIGTWGGGLNYYDSSQNKFINYMPSVHDKGALSDHRVMSLLLDSQGRLWVGTMRSGLNLKQPNQDVFIHYKHDKENPESLSFNGITSILEDAEQNIWVATFGGGLNHYQNGKFVRFKHEENNPFSLCGNRIVGMSLDQQDNIWLATDGGGVCYYSPERQKFISVVLNHPSDKNSKITSVVSIFAGKNGVWAGSKDSGLFLINYPQSDENLSIKYFHRQHGLPSNAIMGVLEDDSGMVWVSSYNGISALTPSTREIKNFSINHGLQGMEYNSGAYFKSSDGQLYFGGNNGFNKIDPKQLWLSMNSFKPATIMTKIKIANYQLSMEESVFDVQQLNLSYQQNAIEFEFASLDFTEPEKNLYKYRLLGFSDTWSSESKSKLASYTNLPFGDYTFQVQGSNNAGVWGPIREIKIEIAPPPWRTIYAYIAYVLLIGCLFWLSYLMMKKREKAIAESETNENLKAYLSCLDQASDGIAITDTSGKLLYKNNSFSRLQSDNKVSSNSAESQLSKLFKNEIQMQKVLQKVASESEWRGELEIHLDKELNIIELSLRKVGIGQNASLVAVAHNITQQKNSEAELRRYRDRLESLVHKRTIELEEEINSHQDAQNKLKVSLKEKEMLLKEVHHRVKNNMQVISSLLNMQANIVNDESLSKLLTESQSRIRSMSLIHESLYRSGNFLEIDFNEYIHSLVSSLSRMYSSDTYGIDLSIFAEHVFLDIDTAVPCGLIINELVSNAYKHAFKGLERKGVVTIIMKEEEGNYLLSVADNGIGFPEGKDFRDFSSLGMEIICILSEQLSGAINLENENGCCFKIVFPKKLG